MERQRADLNKQKKIVDLKELELANEIQKNTNIDKLFSGGLNVKKL